MGKLFTAVINNRLQAYSEENNKINECQAGFRKKFSTTDHIFALDVLVNILQSSKKKLFCGFIILKVLLIRCGEMDSSIKSNSSI